MFYEFSEIILLFGLCYLHLDLFQFLHKYPSYSILFVFSKVKSCGGIASVLWGDSFSTVEVVQYSGGIPSVQWGDSFSTVGG